MNVKPGDQAFIVKSAARPDLIGRVVAVLYKAPSKDFNLPDGYPSDGAGDAPYWVIRFPSVESMKVMGGWNRATIYGVFHDQHLRPIQNPGDDVHDARDILIPQHLKETA